MGSLHLLFLLVPTHTPCGGGQLTQSTIRCFLTLDSVSPQWAFSAQIASWGQALRPGQRQRELGARLGTHCSPGTAALSPLCLITIKAH